MADDDRLTPNLNYNWLRHDGAGVVGDGPTLMAVLEVTVYSDDDVYARGPMECKDGHRGPSRSVKVDVSVRQPDWLAAIIIDARKRGFLG